MAIEQTLSIIKPDAMKKQLVGAIYHRFTSASLQIVAAKIIQLNQQQAEGFYQEHKQRPFFKELVLFMISYPIFVQVLSGDQVVRRYRELMGATNPTLALAGTLRADYGSSLLENVVHGSDALNTAKREINYFFTNDELCDLHLMHKH